METRLLHMLWDEMLFTLIGFNVPRQVTAGCSCHLGSAVKRSDCRDLDNRKIDDALQYTQVSRNTREQQIIATGCEWRSTLKLLSLWLSSHGITDLQVCFCSILSIHQSGDGKGRDTPLPSYPPWSWNPWDVQGPWVLVVATIHHGLDPTSFNMTNHCQKMRSMSLWQYQMSRIYCISIYVRSMS